MSFTVNTPEMLYKRVAKRLQCTTENVELYDHSLKLLSRDCIQFAIQYPREGPCNPVYAFKAGEMVDLRDENWHSTPAAPKVYHTGVVVDDQIDVVYFSHERQLFDYIAKRVHCNGRSDFLLFDCNRKLIKIKSKERPVEKYCKTPYLIAYKSSFN